MSFFLTLPSAVVEWNFPSKSIIPPWHTLPFTPPSVATLGAQVQVFEVFRTQQLPPMWSRGSTYVSNNYGSLLSVSKCLFLDLLMESFANASIYGCCPCCCYSCFQGVAGFLTRWLKYKEVEEGLSCSRVLYCGVCPAPALEGSLRR